ncbi:MAG: tetratricopeptide repeat protein, partial [Candidatus Hodarchaeota archaeon]
YFGYHILGENYLGKRLYDRAIANYEKATRLGGRSITNIAELGFAHALAGNTNKAMDLLRETEEAVCQSNLYYAWVGLIYVGLGHNDKAFEWFEKAYEEHDPFLVYIPSKKWPKLEDFRKDPRFKALLKKMGVAHLA